MIDEFGRIVFFKRDFSYVVIVLIILASTGIVMLISLYPIPVGIIICGIVFSIVLYYIWPRKIEY